MLRPSVGSPGPAPSLRFPCRPIANDAPRRDLVVSALVALAFFVLELVDELDPSAFDDAIQVRDGAEANPSVPRGRYSYNGLDVWSVIPDLRSFAALYARFNANTMDRIHGAPSVHGVWRRRSR